MRHADRWDLPKGHVDEGETELECALRELEEETSIRSHYIVGDPNFRFTIEYPVERKGETFDKRLIVFLAQLVHPTEIVPTEHVGPPMVPLESTARNTT